MRQRDSALNTQRRHAILEAASTCFVKSGFHGTSMKDVCGAAGMSPGTLYHYFRSKTEIIAGIIESEADMTLELLSSLKTTPDFFEALHEVLDFIASEVTEQDLALHTEIAAEILRQPHLRSAQAELDRRALEIVSEALSKAQRETQVDPTLDVDVTAKLILALIDGLLWRATFEGAMTLREQIPATKQLLSRMLQLQKERS
jgi:TetR/AcrR family transcriptional regulator, repressor for uid operon